MKLADCRIVSLLVILVLLWISGTDSQSFTERQHENGRRNEVVKVQKRGYCKTKRKNDNHKKAQ